MAHGWKLKRWLYFELGQFWNVHASWSQQQQQRQADIIMEWWSTCHPYHIATMLIFHWRNIWEWMILAWEGRQALEMYTQLHTSKENVGKPTCVGFFFSLHRDWWSTGMHYKRNVVGILFYCKQKRKRYIFKKFRVSL